MPCVRAPTSVANSWWDRAPVGRYLVRSTIALKAAKANGVECHPGRSHASEPNVAIAQGWQRVQLARQEFIGIHGW